MLDPEFWGVVQAMVLLRQEDHARQEEEKTREGLRRQLK